MQNCPSCGETLPMVNDAFCTYCREPLYLEEDDGDSIVVEYAEPPHECAACHHPLGDDDLHENRKSRTVFTTHAILTVVLSLFVYLAFIVILRAFVGTLLFLAFFLYFMQRSRNTRKRLTAICPACKWQAEFKVPLKSPANSVGGQK